MTRRKMSQEELELFHKHLIDKGFLIEAGWAGFMHSVYIKPLQGDQLRQLRQAFFAGAQHLFASIMTVLDPEENPTRDDLRRMDLIHQELGRFIQEFKLEYLTPPQGRG
jgi:hypothetical protein